MFRWFCVMKEYQSDPHPQNWFYADNFHRFLQNKKQFQFFQFGVIILERMFQTKTASISPNEHTGRFFVKIKKKICFGYPELTRNRDVNWT